MAQHDVLEVDAWGGPAGLAAAYHLRRLGFLNAMRLKGIHLALKTGQLADQAAHEALQAKRRFGESAEAISALSAFGQRNRT